MTDDRFGVSLHESARWLGRQIWLERSLFEIVGRWVPEMDDVEAKAMFATESRHHAFRAELFAGVLPRTHDLDPGALIVPETEQIAAAIEQLRAPATTIERLAAMARVLLPWQLSVLTRRRTQLSPIGDGPALRVLALADTDITRDREAAEETLAALAMSGEGRTVMVALVETLSRALGIDGPPA